MQRRIPNPVVLAFLVVGLAGLAVFVSVYDDAFPEASIELRLTRDDAVARSRDFLGERGFDLSGYRNAAVFVSRRTEIDFLERQSGLRNANGLFRKTVAVWRWRVRWFKELEEVEYFVEYTPDGRLASFRRRLPESAPGPRLDEGAARRLAESFLGRDLGLDLSKYRYIERTMEDRPRRLDRHLVWRLADFDVGGSEYRISVNVQGDCVSGYSQWLKIPETWIRARDETAARRSLLARVNYLPYALLFLALLGIFFWRAHAGGIRWKLSLAAAGVSSLVVFLAQVNSLPFALLSYDTTQSFGDFWAGRLSGPVLSSLVAFAGMLWLFAAADVAGRLFLPDRPWASGVFSGSFLRSGDVSRQVLLGYGLAFAAVGYVTLFYVLGRRFLGVWSPVEVAVSNSFSTYLPSFNAVSTGFGAALREELLFRLFAIALLYRLTAKAWPSVVIPAIVWGFAHTTYPQEPIWIRGLEIGVAGAVYGWAFLRFGLVATLVSHFVYNVFVGVVPQLQSGRAGLVADGLVALTLPLLVLCLAGYLRRPGFREDSPERARPGGNALPPVPADAGGEVAPAPLRARPIPRIVFAGCLLAAVCVYGASLLPPATDFYGKPPAVRLTKQEGAKLCEKALAETGFDARGFTSFTEFDDRVDELPDYVLSRFGIRGALTSYRNYYGFRPEWVTRWYKEKSIRNHEVWVDETGRLTGLRSRLSENDTGARLDEDSAKEVARKFLARFRPEDHRNWEHVETDKIDRPNRFDYGLTYRDRTFKADGLQRKLSIMVSGDVVTEFGSPWYDVPDDWSREREVRSRHLRNTARRIVAALLASGLAVFFIIQMVVLLRRRVARRDDVVQAASWALALGVVPELVKFVNALPHFYHGYFYRTAESLATYALSEVVQNGVHQLIAPPVAIFALFLFARMALRAWMPERGEFGVLLAPLHPSRWGSAENRRGVILGLAAALFQAGLARWESFARTSLSPDLFSPSAPTTDIDVGQVSELLSLVDGIPNAVALSVLLLIVALIFRRFVKRDGWAILFIVLLTGLTSDGRSLSWRNLIIEWSFDLAELAIFYFLATRVLRWNVMAYLVWIWIEVNGGAFSNVSRFLGGSSPEFFWPAAQQAAALALPVAAVILYGFIGTERSPAGGHAAPAAS